MRSLDQKFETLLKENQSSRSPLVTKLPYAYDALEPHISQEIMRLHFDEHYKGYAKKVKEIFPANGPASFEELLGSLSQYDNEERQYEYDSEIVRNNAGGVFNHSMFWEIMSPDSSGQPQGTVVEAINGQFDSFDNFKQTFSTTAQEHFGDGWIWLVVHENHLAIMESDKQDNPLMDVSELSGTPILCLDVWEHAYYLQYKNDKAAYVDAFWNVVNWSKVEQLYNEAKST